MQKGKFCLHGLHTIKSQAVISGCSTSGFWEGVAGVCTPVGLDQHWLVVEQNLKLALFYIKNPHLLPF